ncbi:RagB/SusD family nutrient uptake outer membrane protein [Puteibacter caeruleilacunae]|nr:RagB/SusD family nutrient uptake outer membrane protein [Puteibacter caeruleilacunae]
MKNIIKICAFVLPALFLNQSCSDYLDVVPDDSPTIEIAFENKQTAEGFLATIYSKLPEFSNTNNPAILGGDELWVNDQAQYKNLGGLPGLQIAQGLQSEGQGLLNYWSGKSNLFQGIRFCNTMLENINQPYDMSQEEKDQWAAEAKVLKAYYHFYLMRMYGPIPIVRENLPVSISPEDARVEREPVDDVVAYIVQLIDEALPHLGSTTDGNIEEGRINVAVASAIKAKILITAASPLFNGNTDYAGFVDSNGKELINTTYDAEKWVTAAEACRQAIEAAHAEGHELYQFPLDKIGAYGLTQFTKDKLSIRGAVTEPEDNTEVIWKATGRKMASQQNYFAKMNDPLGKISTFAHRLIGSYYSPTMRVAEMFYSENGVPIAEDKDYNYSARYVLREGDAKNSLKIGQGMSTVGLHFDREPRFYASIGFDNGYWFGHDRYNEFNTWICQTRGGATAGYTGDPNVNTWSATGYFAKKMVHYETMMVEATSGFSQHQYSWPVIRLADLYLMYAEALNEVSGPGANVYEWIDKVRERAAIPHVQEAWSAHAKNPGKVSDQDGLREIIHHERMIELVFEGHRFWDLRRWKRAQEFMNNRFVKGWNVYAGQAENYYQINNIYQQTFEAKDYLWPIPLTNILYNPKLVQNPGW